MRPVIALLAAMLFLAAGAGCRTGKSVPTRVSGAGSGKETTGAGVALFNGRDLSGFYTWLVDTRYADPRGVFSVTNGSLHISGDGLGYLATTRTFRDFELTLEFKWGSLNTRWGDRLGRARDSGVFLHATGPDGNSADGKGAFMAAIECNVFEGATGDLLLIRGTNASGLLIAPRVTVLSDGRRDADGWPWWSPRGQPLAIETWGRINWQNKDSQWRDETGFRGTHDVERPAGEWNRLSIVCQHDEIFVRLNGVPVNQVRQVRPVEGKILLQCEGSEIFFRRIELLERSSTSADH